MYAYHCLREWTALIGQVDMFTQIWIRLLAQHQSSTVTTKHACVDETDSTGLTKAEVTDWNPWCVPACSCCQHIWQVQNKPPCWTHARAFLLDSFDSLFNLYSKSLTIHIPATRPVRHSGTYSKCDARRFPCLDTHLGPSLECWLEIDHETEL